MSGGKFNFSITQLLLITALCGLITGLVAASRRESSTRYLHGLAFSPDGRLLAALGATDSVIVWDLSRDPPARAELPIGADSHLYYHDQSLAFIDESTVAVVVPRTTPNIGVEILLWDVIRDVRKKSTPLKPMQSLVTFSSDGRRAATLQLGTGRGGTVEIWDVATGKQCGTITPNNYPHLAATSDDGQMLTVVPLPAAGSSATAEIWRVNPPKLLKTLNVGGVSAGDALSPDGRLLFTVAPDNEAIWDLTSGASVPLKTEQMYWSGRFSPDGSSLVALGYDGVDVWDTRTGKLRGQIAGDESQYVFYRASVAFSPDGNFFAVATDEEVSLWDAQTCRRVRTLTRSRRFLSIVMFSTGFIAWAVIWGVVGRRRRRRESWDAPVAPARTKLPANIQAALRPGRTWLKFLLVIAVFAVPWAWINADWMQDSWGVSYWVAFAIAFTIMFVGFPALLILGVTVWRKVAWQTKGILERNVKRAASVAGVSGRRAEFGPVTAVFFGSSQFELTIQQDYEAVRKRFSDIVGEPVEPHDPLLILVFERPEIFDAYFNGHMPMGGVYWAFRGRQIIICEQRSLERLTEPRRVLRYLFGNYFCEQYKGFLIEPWLQMVVSQLAATGSEPDILRRDHRSLRVWQQRDPASAEPGLLTMPQREALQLLLDTNRPEGFRRSACYGCQMASLAEFLAGPDAGDRRERFQRFLRDLKRGERSEQVFVRNFDYGFDRLMQDWHVWALTQEIEPYDPPPPIIKRHIEEQLLPLIADESAPLAERAEAVRRVGGGAYRAGAYVLIDLLRPGAAHPLHDDAVWALERVSGETHGDDVAAWQEWWERSVHQQEPHDDAPAAEPIQAVLVADEEAPVLAELADEPDGSLGNESQGPFMESTESMTSQAASRRVPRDAPTSLKTCWVLFVVAGVISIIWSVVTVLQLYGPFDFSGVWIVIGCYGIAAGIYAITRGAGRGLDRLKLAATMLMLCFVNCNFISVALGIAIHFVLLRPELQAYISAGPGRSRLPDGTY